MKLSVRFIGGALALAAVLPAYGLARVGTARVTQWVDPAPPVRSTPADSRWVVFGVVALGALAALVVIAILVYRLVGRLVALVERGGQVKDTYEYDDSDGRPTMTRTRQLLPPEPPAAATDWAPPPSWANARTVPPRDMPRIDPATGKSPGPERPASRHPA